MHATMHCVYYVYTSKHIYMSMHNLPALVVLERLDLVHSHDSYAFEEVLGGVYDAVHCEGFQLATLVLELFLDAAEGKGIWNG